MTKDMELMVKKILPMVSADALEIQKANSIVPISGKRYKLPLEGRNIDIAYYQAKSEKAPLIVGYHGGGFLYGGSALDDMMWKTVAEYLDVNVASVNYRLSPKYRAWEAIDDCYDSIIYLKEHAADFGFDPEHISVMGQSAGANCAAAMGLKTNMTGEIKLDNQIILYPIIDFVTDPDSKGEGSFTGAITYIMNELHCTLEEAKDPLISPLFASKEMMQGSANAILCFCENDNLREEGIEYERKLKDAGVNTASVLSKGMPHGFFESAFKKKLGKGDSVFGEEFVRVFETGAMKERGFEVLELIKNNMVR